MKKVIFLFLLTLFACKKEKVKPIEPDTINMNAPIMIQVEAVHDNGVIVNSPILVLQR